MVFSCLSWRSISHNLMSRLASVTPQSSICPLGSAAPLPAGIHGSSSCRDLWLLSPCPHGCAAGRDSLAVPSPASPVMTPAVGGTISRRCCGHRLQQRGLLFPSSSESRGDNGNQQEHGAGVGAALTPARGRCAGVDSCCPSSVCSPLPPQVPPMGWSHSSSPHL